MLLASPASGAPYPVRGGQLVAVGGYYELRHVAAPLALGTLNWITVCSLRAPLWAIARARDAAFSAIGRLIEPTWSRQVGQIDR